MIILLSCLLSLHIITSSYITSCQISIFSSITTTFLYDLTYFEVFVWSEWEATKVVNVFITLHSWAGLLCHIPLTEVGHCIYCTTYWGAGSQVRRLFGCVGGLKYARCIYSQKIKLVSQISCMNEVFVYKQNVSKVIGGHFIRVLIHFLFGHFFLEFVYWLSTNSGEI